MVSPASDPTPVEAAPTTDDAPAPAPDPPNAADPPTAPGRDIQPVRTDASGRRGSFSDFVAKSRRNSAVPEERVVQPPKSPPHPPTVSELMRPLIEEGPLPRGQTGSLMYTLPSQSTSPLTTKGVRTGPLNPRGPIGIFMNPTPFRVKQRNGVAPSKRALPKVQGEYPLDRVAGQAGKGVVLQCTYHNNKYEIDENKAFSKMPKSVQKKVMKELQKTADGVQEEMLNIQKAAETDNMKEWQEAQKALFVGGERTIKWRGEYIDSPGTLYERPWEWTAGKPGEQTWKDHCTEKGLFSPQREERKLARNRKAPWIMNPGAGVFAEPIVTQDQVGRMRDLYNQFEATGRAWPTRWATGCLADGPDTPGRARCTVSQLAAQDSLNLTRQQIGQQRRCVTPLGTLRPTTSMDASQSPGFATKGRSLGRDTRGRRASVCGLASPSACPERSKSPQRTQLEGELGQLMRGKKRGETVSRDELVIAVSKLAHQTNLDKQASRIASRTPVGRGVARPSTQHQSRAGTPTGGSRPSTQHQSRAGTPTGGSRPSTQHQSRAGTPTGPFETRMDSVGRHFGSSAHNLVGKTRKDESFRRTKYNAQIEMICDAPI